MNAEEIADALKLAAVHEGNVAIAFTGVEIDGMKATATVQLLTFDDDGSLRNIHEQGLLAAAPLFNDPARVRAFAEGLKLALTKTFKAPRETLETLVPADLVFFEVLELKKPQTPEEFRDALLTKKRLGRFCA